MTLFDHRHRSTLVAVVDPTFGCRRVDSRVVTVTLSWHPTLTLVDRRYGRSSCVRVALDRRQLRARRSTTVYPGVGGKTART